MIAVDENSGKGKVPFRITFVGQLEQSHDRMLANIHANKYTPMIQQTRPHDRPLAIVGGGPSVLDKLDALRSWSGDIWSINRTPEWLAKQGIKSTLISVDASERLAEWSAPEYVEDAIMSSWCPPAIVDMYKNVRIFHMQPFVPGGIYGGSTTASSMPVVTALLGYKDVTYFGCESSFVDQDHAYLDEKREHQLIVRAEGKDYRTTPPFLIQAQELSALMRQLGPFYKEESGGLLRAMITDQEWEIVAVSEAMKDHLEEVNGKEGLYLKPYAWNG